MSFVLELNVDGLTDEQGRAVESACRARAAWPVEFHPRRRRRWAPFGPREVGPALWMPEQLEQDRHILSDAASWDARAWDMESALLPPFAEAIRILGQNVPQGFTFRATWVGEEIREERELTADELADLVLISQLAASTLYRVPGRTR